VLNSYQMQSNCVEIFEFDVLIYIQSNPFKFNIIQPNLTAIRHKCNINYLIQKNSSELCRIHIKCSRIVSNFLYFSILHYT
jgi:hypothetical protein